MLRNISYILIAFALLVMARPNTANPPRASATAPVKPGAVVAEPQSSVCDPCRPKLSAPAVRYLRHNGSQHEVEVAFTYSLPACFDRSATPNFRVALVRLQFPNGKRRERLNAGVAEGGTCTSSSGSCKTLVRVAGPASDGRPRSYFASVIADIPIQGFGISSNNAPIL